MNGIASSAERFGNRVVRDDRYNLLISNTGTDFCQVRHKSLVGSREDHGWASECHEGKCKEGTEHDRDSRETNLGEEG